MKDNIDKFAEYIMQSIKSDFMYRAKYKRTTYTMEEILWIVHEDIEECVHMYEYDGEPDKQKPDIRMPITTDNTLYESRKKYITEYGQMSEDMNTTGYRLQYFGSTQCNDLKND